MEITYARKENTCHLPGLVHIELGNLSRQNLQAAIVKMDETSEHRAFNKLTTYKKLAQELGRVKPGLQQP